MKCKVERKKLSVQDAIEYIEDSRIPLKVLRQQLNSKVIVVFFNQDIEEDLFMFALGIRGILQGGMTGKHANNISLIIKNYIKKVDFSQSGLVLYQGKHTLVDLIEYFKKGNRKSIYYTDEIIKYKNNENYIREKFLELVNRQICSIDEYWMLITLAYERIKFDNLV